MAENRKLANDELNRISPEEYKQVRKLPIVVVLDNVRSLNNIGSVFRTSDALGVEQIYLCGISGTPPHREIHKTALGAEDSVPWQYFESTIDAIKHLEQQGYKIVSLEQTEKSISLTDYAPTFDRKYALVFGNEVKGVDQAVVNLSHECIEIPQFGTKHSFNISVTAAIVLWDFFSKVKP